MIRTTLTSILGAFALLSTACAADDSSDDGVADTTTDPATTDPATTDPATTDPTSTSDADSSTGAASCQTDVCATYGAAVPDVSSAIVDMAAVDPMFMADFAPLVAQGDAAVLAFKTSLANFISDAYGCTTDAYTGPTMEAAHAGLDITQEEYDAFIGIIVTVLTDFNVLEDDITLCFAPPLVDPAFVGTIVGQ